MTREEFAELSGVSRETLEKFEIWYRLLEETNAHTNLVGRSTLADFWTRHAFDSFQLFEHMPQTAQTIIDMGAGAGFPGIALALGLQDRGRPGSVLMIDSVGKKVAFLKKVIAETGAPAEARAIRVEALDPANPVDLVTARAFAPMDKLLGYAEPLLKNGAEGLFLKGRSYQDELTDARKNWTFNSEVIPSRTSDGVILKIHEVQRAR
ncbi:MAG: 16S rRNA (guanine(527)-N(7))-methyltransferase RsmG [Alphaproteobacteria bacterium]|nr:16S rRNA (guanine(527)-N(7))-methyltransferase RsmG [Alphaproteobacteria bacterium]